MKTTKILLVAIVLMALVTASSVSVSAANASGSSTSGSTSPAPIGGYATIYGSVSGRYRDSFMVWHDLGSISGANIKITRQGTGSSTPTTSGYFGGFSFSVQSGTLLNPIRYSISGSYTTTVDGVSYTLTGSTSVAVSHSTYVSLSLTAYHPDSYSSGSSAPLAPLIPAPAPGTLDAVLQPM